MGLFSFRHADPAESTELPGQVPDPTVTRDETVFQETRRAAIRTGRLEEVEQRIEGERAFFAELAIAKTGCAPWDPESNPADRLADLRFRRATERRSALLDAVERAEDLVREGERIYADLGPEPATPGLTRSALALVGAASLTPGLGVGVHGFLASMGVVHTVLGALGPALGAAGLCVASSVGTASATHDGRRRAAVAGVALALSAVTGAGVNEGSLGAVGSGPAWAGACFVFAVLMVIELAACWLAEATEERRVAMQPWHAAGAGVLQARATMETRRSELRETDLEIEAHEAAVSVRTSTHLSGLEHAEAARRTADAGAARGIYEQDGWAWAGIRVIPRAHRLRARHRGLPVDEETEA